MTCFNIKKAPINFEIKSDSLESYLHSKEQSNYSKISCEKLSDDSVATLYILPSAFLELNEHISWKKKTQTNLSEQGGILLGSVYKDNATQLICGVVQHIIPSAKSGNATYIQFTHNDWIMMYKEFEDKYSSVKENEKQLKVIGWYHTHPNMPVNMSGIDKNTHIGFFSEVWQFSVILNPQWGTWAVFNGAECKNCNGYIYCLLPKNVDSRNILEEPNRTQFEIPVRTKQHQTLTLNDSFVIKNRSDVSLKGSQHNAHPVCHAGNYSSTSKSISMEQHYKDGNLFIKNTCYHLPINLSRIVGEKDFIISDTLVRKFASFIDDWSFEGEESIALIYYLYESLQFMEKGSNVKYYTFNDSDGLSADGFIFISASDEYFEYLSGYKENVSLVVVYSAVRPTCSGLSEMYGNYDYVLWINSHDTNEFLLYFVRSNTKCMKNNFNAKNYGVSGTEQRIVRQAVHNGHDLFDNLLLSSNFLYSKYLGTEYGEVNKPPLFISKNLIEQFISRIKRYKINSGFSIIISYKTPDYPSENQKCVNPLIHEFSRVLVFKNITGNKILGCDIKGLDRENYCGKLSKFALIISNRNVDIDKLKSKLVGHLTALYVNIENQDRHFYRLF